MTIEPPRVTILLATFNGSNYLEEQLSSIMNQQGVVVEIIVNDDGSTDGTLEILNRWQKEGLIISICNSDRTGPTKSFFKLLSECGNKPLVAFCDQDDVWEPTKLLSLTEIIEFDSPCVAFSRRRYIDHAGLQLKRNPEKLFIKPSFENALVENVIPGNTMLLNEKAITLINSSQKDEIKNYDWWIYLLISAFGSCKLCPDRLISYRIHGGNFTGLRKISLSRGFESVHNSLVQANQFKEQFCHKLTKEHYREIENYTACIESSTILLKLKSLVKVRIHRQSWSDAVIFKTFLLYWIFRIQFRSHSNSSK